MKNPYVCCGCSREFADRPIHLTCNVCKSSVIHVPTWEAEMLANAQKVCAQLGNKPKRLVLAKAGK